MVSGPSKMLIDEMMPVFDATIIEHIVIDARSRVVYDAAREMNFLEVHSPMVDAAMAVRGLPAMIGRRLGRESSAPAAPPEMRLSGFFDEPATSDDFQGWLGLGEVPGAELVFGAIGKVWQPDIDWREVSRDAFRDFDEPDYAKLAVGFSLRDYGENRTLLSYEARTAGTDADARRKFLRYWTLIRRFAGVVMRAALHTVKDLAEAEAEPEVGADAEPEAELEAETLPPGTAADSID